MTGSGRSKSMEPRRTRLRLRTSASSCISSKVSVKAAYRDGIVKIARGFTINGDNGKTAEVFARTQLTSRDDVRNSLGFINDVCRKTVWQMILANDDFNIDSEIIFKAQNFNYASASA